MQKIKTFIRKNEKCLIAVSVAVLTCILIMNGVHRESSYKAMASIRQVLAESAERKMELNEEIGRLRFRVDSLRYRERIHMDSLITLYELANDEHEKLQNIHDKYLSDEPVDPDSLVDALNAIYYRIKSERTRQ